MISVLHQAPEPLRHCCERPSSRRGYRPLSVDEEGEEGGCEDRRLDDDRKPTASDEVDRVGWTMLIWSFSVSAVYTVRLHRRALPIRD